MTGSHEGAVRDVLERAPLGLEDYEPQVEPEYVWRSGVSVYKGHPMYPGNEWVKGVFADELTALRARINELAHPKFVREVFEPCSELLADTFARARKDGVPVVLLDEEGNEVRRWVL